MINNKKVHIQKVKVNKDCKLAEIFEVFLYFNFITDFICI